jgi:hypothetical protein
MICLLSVGSCAIPQKRVEILNHWTHDRPLEAELAFRVCLLVSGSAPVAHRCLPGVIWNRPERWKQELSWICRAASVPNCWGLSG